MCFWLLTKNVDFLRPFSVRHIVGGVENSESQIQDIWGLAVSAIPLVVLGFIKERKSCGHMSEARASASKLANEAWHRSDGLGLVTVDQVRQVTNGAMSTRIFTEYHCELAIGRREYQRHTRVCPDVALLVASATGRD